MGLCVPRERGALLCVKPLDVPGIACFFVYIILILMRMLQIRKLRLGEIKSFTQGHPSR